MLGRHVDSTQEEVIDQVYNFISLFSHAPQ